MMLRNEDFMQIVPELWVELNRIAIATGGMHKGMKKAAPIRPMEQLIDILERVHISLRLGFQWRNFRLESVWPLNA